MTRFPILTLVCALFLLGLAGCGSGGGSGGGSSGGSLGGGGSGGGGGDGGTGGGGSGGGGGEVDPPFVSAFRVLDVPDPEGVYNALLNARDSTFQHAIFAPVGINQNTATFTSVVDPANIPASGSIDYAGHLFVFVSNTATATGASVVGDATLSVDVNGRTISGIATGFLSNPNNEQGTPQIVDYQGDIVISNGSLTNSGGIAAVAIGIDGTLDDAVNTFVINNTLVGALYGAGGGGLSAGHNRVASAMNSTINGNAATYDQATLRAIRQP